MKHERSIKLPQTGLRPPFSDKASRLRSWSVGSCGGVGEILCVVLHLLPLCRSPLSARCTLELAKTSGLQSSCWVRYLCSSDDAVFDTEKVSRYFWCLMRHYSSHKTQMHAADKHVKTARQSLRHHLQMSGKQLWGPQHREDKAPPANEAPVMQVLPDALRLRCAAVHVSRHCVTLMEAEDRLHILVDTVTVPWGA